MKKKLGIIGFGNMGSSLFEALKQRYKVYIFDKIKEKLQKAKASAAKSVEEVLRNCDAVVVAIKPQDIKDFLDKEKEVFLKHKPLVISIAAGVSTSYWERNLPKLGVVRVMPNLGVKVKKAVSFICKGKYAHKEHLYYVKEIFSSVGEVYPVKEELLNKVTAISGSGPGYVFYFMDTIYKIAREMGFSRKVSYEMVVKIFESACAIAAGGDNFENLVKAVASPRGTTEAALGVFKKRNLAKSIKEAIEAANKRGEELSSLYN